MTESIKDGGYVPRYLHGQDQGIALVPSVPDEPLQETVEAQLERKYSQAQEYARLRAERAEKGTRVEAKRLVKAYDGPILLQHIQQLGGYEADIWFQELAKLNDPAKQELIREHFGAWSAR